MDRLEADPGTWDFSATDAVVQNDTAHGLDTEGILIGPPAWAVAAGQKPGNGLPRGLGRPVTDTANVWADFVAHTVRHYAGKVAFWEIWNEPDMRFFWSSSPSEYYQLLKVSYTVIKSVDPSARVVMAGMVVPDLTFLTQVVDAAAADASARSAHGYFDIAAWHAYGPVRAAYDNVRRVRSILAGAGFGSAPIWVTEAGFPASNPNGEDRQAAYVLQSIAYGFAAGADRVFVYRASDDSTIKTWGLISADGIPRSASVSFELAAQYLSHVGATSYDPTGTDERFVFYTPSKRITLIWNHGLTDRSLALSAGQPSATQVDAQGNVSRLNAAAGQFRVTAPGALYNRVLDPAGSVVGGPPVMIVEDNVRPAGLGPPAYIPPVSGPGRQLVVLNDAATPTSVEVSVPGVAGEREDLLLPPHSVHFVDLDLLAGMSYAGLFRVSSTATITAQALSGASPVPGMSPSGSWTVSAAPATLLLSNPTSAAIAGTITAYGFGGKVRLRESVTVPPLGTVRWIGPANLRARGGVSLSIAAAGKIVVSGPSGPLTNAVSQPQSTWYTIAPHAAHLVAFNPSAIVSARVRVRFVGSSRVRVQQVKLAGHRSYTFSTRRARTVVVSANRAITMGYANPVDGSAPLDSLPTTHAVLTAGGTATQVLVYNPSRSSAHIGISVVGRVNTYASAATVGPSGVYSVQVRKATEPARGVIISSDIPVVSTPSS